MSEQPILGRTSKKWQPFASIPQQFKGISNIIENQKKVPQPILDEDEQERLNYILMESIERKYEVSLVYWSKGRIETEVGYIKKTDTINNTVQFIDKFNCTHTLALTTLVNVVIM